MPIIRFDEALGRTANTDRSLLIGNGFSIEHFNYRNLLANAGLDDNEPLNRLFKALDTFDFETVIKALEDAAVVGEAYDSPSQTARFRLDAERLRRALVHAIRTTHPAHREDISNKIPSCVRFLRNFSDVFSLNYDLLLYWVQLGAREFKDGFGLGKEQNGFRGPFKEDAYCNIYYVHGALHLFQTQDGDVEKRLASPSIIDSIAYTVTQSRRLPVYVAEGSSPEKMAKINSVPYLRHCYNILSQKTGVVFIYGHSASRNDEHIYRAIFGSKIEHVFFCVHQPSSNVPEIDGELARYQRLFGSDVEYTLVDSQTAEVWARQD